MKRSGCRGVKEEDAKEQEKNKKYETKIWGGGGGGVRKSTVTSPRSQ